MISIPVGFPCVDVYIIVFRSNELNHYRSVDDKFLHVVTLDVDVLRSATRLGIVCKKDCSYIVTVDLNWQSSLHTHECQHQFDKEDVGAYFQHSYIFNLT